MNFRFLLIPALATACLAEEPAQIDFDSLFDGESLEGWRGEGYIVEDGAIVCTPEGRNLLTDRRFANFVLDMEFKLPPGGNNGLAVNYPGEGPVHETGMEIQILDNQADQYAKLKPAQYHGSIYMLVPAKRDAPLVDGWNAQRVIVSGPQLKVELNGELITETDLDKLAEEHPEHEGIRRRGGFLGLCGHNDPVAFRNIRVAEFPPAANIEGVKSAGFEPLFDGETFDGWKLESGSEGHWRIHNGIIKYDGKSTAEIKDLWTEESFGDFTLVLDWRWSGIGVKMQRPVIGPDGNQTGETVEAEELDSGIYLRGNTKAQINLWNWPVGSGEVWGYRTDANMPAEVRTAVTPLVPADRPLGEWNRTMITLRGDRLTVVLNGLTVIHEAQLPDVPAEGPIGLQHHGQAIDFANLWIKEL